jgi:hypothetical protein
MSLQLSTWGQIGNLFYDNEDGSSGLKRSIQLQSAFLSGSDRFTTGFLKDYWNGGYLSMSSREAQYGRLDQKNDLGFLWNSSLVYIHPDTKLGVFSGLRISYNHFMMQEASLTRGLFGLYFLGNANTDTIPVELGPSREKREAFQSIKLGSGFSKGPWDFRFNLGFALGNHYLDRKIRAGSLSTSSNASEIGVDLDFVGINSDFGKNPFSYFTGIGFVSDLGLAYQFSQTMFISVEVNRLGFMVWNRDLQKVIIDTSYLFDGVEVQGFLDSLYLDIESTQDLEDRFSNSTPLNSLGSALPWDITVKVHKTWYQNRLVTNAWFRWMPESFYENGFECSLGWRPLSWFNVSLHAGAGNYSRFNSGLGIGLQLPSGVEFDFRISSLSNMLNSSGDASWFGSLRFYKSL